MSSLLRITIIFLTLCLNMGCSMLALKTPEPLHKSSNYYEYIQPTYTDYLTVTKQWMQHSRHYISVEHDKELAMNMPFELGDKQNSNKAILLVHGLGDSPYSFSDLAKSFQNQGFYVQTLLLPGHGSKPQDLMLPRYSDWQNTVDHYASLLKQDFKHVWLGGFSTGANLATIHAIEQGGISGLMLFSPGFQSQAVAIEGLASFVSLFFDGFEAKEENLAKYTSAPINGAIAYSESATRVRDLLNHSGVDIPTLIAISEADSVLDSYAIKDLYLEHFKHSDNKMIWYGEKQFEQDSIKSLGMKLESMKVSTGSHMSPIYSPSNSYYGAKGEYRMCRNSLDKAAKTRCEKSENVWYSAWGYQEKEKIYARLTWNPYFAELEKEIAAFVW